MYNRFFLFCFVHTTEPLKSTNMIIMKSVGVRQSGSTNISANCCFVSGTEDRSSAG